MSASAKLLNNSYRTEEIADVSKQLLVVRLVGVDNEETDSIDGKEFHESRLWPYKWLKSTQYRNLQRLLSNLDLDLHFYSIRFDQCRRCLPPYTTNSMLNVYFWTNNLRDGCLVEALG
jgi:hypothetical protein